MSSYPEFAIIGMGRSGMSMARYLMRQGIAFDVMDETSCHCEGIAPRQQFTGPLDAALLCRYRQLLVSPGIPWQHPALQAARAAGVKVCGDLELFASQFPCALYTITGTNGKTTATHLLQQLLQHLPGDCVSAGNIGTPMLDVLDAEHLPQRVVLELSSFQLERSAGIHPQWAVLLNVQPDHADMHDSAEAYQAAKLRLFANQQAGDTAMLPMDHQWDDVCQQLYDRGVYVHRFGFAQAGELMAETLSAGVLRHGRKTWRLFWHQLGKKEQINCRHVSLRGLHQQINMAVAAQGAADAGVPADVIRDTLIRFRGLPHRLQYVGETAGKAWYDDSKATNPTAAIAALRSFERVIWICGGLRKGLDLTPMIPTVRQHVSHALIIGEEPDAWVDMLTQAEVAHAIAGNMERAVHMAVNLQSASDVLLSPAAASQDQFANYAERGRAFVNAMASLSTTIPVLSSDEDTPS